LVGHREEDGEDTDQEAHDVQLLDAHHMQKGGGRDQREEQGAADIGADEEWPPSHAIGPYPGEQADEQARRVPGGGQEPHLRRRGMEREGRREG